MRKMTKREPFYDLEAVLTSGVLCVCSGRKMIRLREAMEFVEKLGRPLTDEEEKQFEID